MSPIRPPRRRRAVAAGGRAPPEEPSCEDRAPHHEQVGPKVTGRRLRLLPGGDPMRIAGPQRDGTTGGRSRLAFAIADRIATVRLNAEVRDRSLLFRTTDDAELLTEQRLPASFEIDGWDARSAWSVIARGGLHRISDTASLEQETRMGQVPWAPPENGPRTTLIELAVDHLEGREFQRRRWQGPRWTW